MDRSLLNPVGVHFVFESGYGEVIFGHFMVHHRAWHEQRSWAFFSGLSELTCNCAQQLGQLIGFIAVIYIV